MHSFRNIVSKDDRYQMLLFSKIHVQYTKCRHSINVQKFYWHKYLWSNTFEVIVHTNNYCLPCIYLKLNNLYVNEQ